MLFDMWPADMPSATAASLTELNTSPCQICTDFAIDLMSQSHSGQIYQRFLQIGRIRYTLSVSLMINELDAKFF